MDGQRESPVGSGAEHYLLRRLHGGQTSMRLGPMASQRQGKPVCAHLGLRWAAVKAGDGDTARPRLIVGDGGLQWFSSDVGGTYGCGGPWRSFRGSWFSKSGSVSRRRWPLVVLGFQWDFILKIWALGAPFYRGFHTNPMPTLASISCTRWIWTRVTFWSDFCGNSDWGKVSSCCSAPDSGRRRRWSWAARWA
jgi:hypothetical protein